MNLKKLFIPLLAIATLASCSKDDDLGPKEPDMTPDAFLTLAVKSELQTKADGTVAPRDVISDLTVLVYINDIYHAYGDTTLEKTEEPKPPTLNAVSRIPVKSGNVKVLVVANGGDRVNEMKDKELPLTKALSTVSAFLNDETHKHLTMSSQVFSVTIRAGKNNYVGFNGSFPGGDQNGVDVPGAVEAIKLYRNVARIQLSELKLAESSDFGTPVSFKLDSIFLANVKAYSYLCPTDGSAWGPVECPITDENYWWFGACPGTAFGDSLTDIKAGGVTPLMLIPFNEKKGDLKNHYDGGTYSVEPITLDKSNRVYPVREQNAPINPIGHFFYVYENTEEKSPTLLVLRGDYTYTIAGTEKDTTLYNRYYPVIVNDKGKGSFVEVNPHSYIKRNTQYSINLTISGPGSEQPYDPSTRAYLGGTIKVLDWKVIEMTESAD